VEEQVMFVCRTCLGHNCPADFKEKLLSFQLHQLQKMNNYILSQIGSAYETSVYFDMPSYYTVHYISTKYMLNETLGNVKM
jgi:hypothetical protein